MNVMLQILLYGGGEKIILEGGVMILFKDEYEVEGGVLGCER